MAPSVQDNLWRVIAGRSRVNPSGIPLSYQLTNSKDQCLCLPQRSCISCKTVLTTVLTHPTSKTSAIC